MLGKGYLKLLVDKLRVDGNKVCVRGSHAVLAAAIADTKLGTAAGDGEGKDAQFWECLAPQR
jgi:hypothetical protein